MNKLTIISDTHCYHNRIKLLDGDILIHGGDFSSKGREPEVKDFFNWFKNQPHQYKIVIPGNHDLCAEPSKYKYIYKKPCDWFNDVISDYTSNPNNYYLHNTGCIINNLKFWGSGITPSFHREWWALNQDRGQEIQQTWKNIPTDTDVLITHGPPAYKLDYIPNQNTYVGCEDLLFRIKEIKPLLNIFGHIHESYGVERDEYSTYINASILDGNYYLKNKPWVVEITKDREIKIEDYVS